MQRYLLLMILAMGLGVTNPSSATIVKTFSMPEMVHESHEIVRGYVTEVRSVYDKERKHVYTHTTVEVQEDLRSASLKPRLIVIRQLGGSVDGFETTLVGNASLGLGEEVVVFARTDGVFHYLVGMAQGKYSVQRTKGTPQLKRSLHGIRGVKRPDIARPQAPNALSLKELRSHVKASLNTGGQP